MKDRAFGVEIEFGSNELGREGVARTLREAFDREGIRRWYFMDRLGYDGSEIELRTPPLRGKEGFEKLKLVMDTLLDHDCYTSYDDGLHVHHDAPEFTHNIDNCIRLVKSWKANSHIIYQFVDPYRTYDEYEETGYWACPSWTEQKVKIMELEKEIPNWERNDLNLNSLSRHGTIEIRLHEGTLNYSDAEAWIKFGQSFIDRTLKHAMRDSKDATKLLKKVKVSSSAQKTLIDKAARLKGRY